MTTKFVLTKRFFFVLSFISGMIIWVTVLGRFIVPEHKALFGTVWHLFYNPFFIMYLFGILSIVSISACVVGLLITAKENYSRINFVVDVLLSIPGIVSFTGLLLFFIFV